MRVIEWLLEEDGEEYVLKSKVKSPYPSGYRLELDVTDEIGDTLALRFMKLIGIMRWVAKLGRFDINYKVSTFP